MTHRYLVTIEFPAPHNCERGEVTWEEVVASSEEEAAHKARLAVLHRLQVNKITRGDECPRVPRSLHPWRVSLHEQKGDKFTLFFNCQAEDSEHAYEQAENAYPDGEILLATQEDQTP